MTLVESLGVAGSIASLVGLVVTVYVAWTIRQLRYRYVRQGMLETCLGKLQAHQKNLSRPSTAKNAAAIRENLKQIRIAVERIAVYTPKNSTIEWRLDQVDKLLQANDDSIRNRVGEIKPLLAEWIERLEFDLKEIGWEK